MKPPEFIYHRPGSVEEALGVLAEVGSEGKVLAGGQSLVPMLNMRLAAPHHLIDINRLTELDYVRMVPDEGGRAVEVGAVARHTDVERDAEARARLPLLGQALRHVAHPTIRNRGTTVGSLVHADPSGEMTAVLALLGGTVELRTARSARTVPADEFFLGPLESCAQPDELAMCARFPVPQGRTGSSWLEIARRNGDYAVCGVGALVTVDEENRITAARVAYVSVGPVPVVLELGDAVGQVPLNAADWTSAASYAADRLQPEDDIHATAGYRSHIAAVLTARALRAAGARAAGAGDGGADDVADGREDDVANPEGGR